MQVIISFHSMKRCFVIKQGAFKGLGLVAYKLANFYLRGTIGFEGQQHLIPGLYANIYE